MQYIFINFCVKRFDYDRLRNDRALGTGKSYNNKNPKLGTPSSRTRTTTTRITFVAWAPFSGSKNLPYFGFGNLATLHTNDTIFRLSEYLNLAYQR